MNNRKFALSMIMKFSIFALQFGFFAMVLFQYYGPRLFRRADSIGYAVTLILYAIVYVALGNLFRAFKITDYSIAETIFSQFLSFGRPWSEMDGRAFSSTKAATRRPRPFGSHGFPCSVTAT